MYKVLRSYAVVKQSRTNVSGAMMTLHSGLFECSKN